MTLAEALAQVLREERVERGWTQAELAGFVQMTRGGFAHVETGRNGVTLEQLEKLARVFKVAPSALMLRAEYLVKVAPFGVPQAQPKGRPRAADDTGSCT